jgi:DHA1 family inner membrane transport protein
MSFLGNDAVNRVNLHSAIHALAQSGGFVFFVVYLVRAGVPVPIALCAMAAITAVRFMIRPVLVPLARRFGIKPLLMTGTVAMAMQFPVLAQVHGVNGTLAALCLVTAIGEVFYWPTYNAYFAAIGDPEHRGQQIGAREAIVAVAGVLAPLIGGWALVVFGPHLMFASVAVVQILAVIPLIGAPNVAVPATAPGAFRAARIGVILSAVDGWFDACFIFAWQIALFLSLGESFAAYGGAMALVGLVGAVIGLVMGRHIDLGRGRRAVMIAYACLTAIVLLRSISLGSPLFAIVTNALGAFLGTLLLPAGAATYNLAKASPCPMRFIVATEAAWDTGCFTCCLIAAGLIEVGVPLSLVILVGIAPLPIAMRVLLGYYGRANA